jgi:hypothetical protein
VVRRGGERSQVIRLSLDDEQSDDRNQQEQPDAEHDFAASIGLWNDDS